MKDEKSHIESKTTAAERVVIAFDGAGALGDPERGWPLRGFVLGGLHSGDRSGRGPAPEPSDESVDLRRFAADQYLDAAVGEIAGVPGDPELVGPSLRAATVEDALHSPAHPADSAYHMGVLLGGLPVQFMPKVPDSARRRSVISPDHSSYIHLFYDDPCVQCDCEHNFNTRYHKGPPIVTRQLRL